MSDNRDIVVDVEDVDTIKSLAEKTPDLSFVCHNIKATFLNVFLLICLIERPSGVDGI